MSLTGVDFRTRHGPPWWAWVAAAAPFAIAAAFGWKAIAASRASRAEQEAHLLAQAQAAEERARSTAPPPYARGVSAYLHQASLDWPAALRAIEMARNDRMRVKAIDIIAETRKVTVEIEYQEGQALTEFVTALNLESSETLWSLTSITASDPANPAAGLAIVHGKLRDRLGAEGVGRNSRAR